MRQVFLAILLVAPSAIGAEVAQLLIAKGFSEVDATSIPAWNSHVDRAFAVSMDSGCLRVEVGVEQMSNLVTAKLGPFLYEGTDEGEWAES